jgi:hypothetical protein
MRIWWLLSVLVCGMLCAQANDSYVVGESGRVQRMAGEHPTVRLVREWVKVDVYPDYYEVAVQFVFRNDGPATTVQMGFPERGAGDINAQRLTRETGFRHFRTWVDGTVVTAERLPAAIPDEDTTYRTFWVKTVAFAQGQTRTVRVEYRSPIHADSMGDRWASYDFTGGNWAGSVDESSLRVIMHLPGAYLINPGMPMTQQKNQFSTRWTNWQAETGFTIGFLPTRADAYAVRTIPDAPFTGFARYRHMLVMPGKGEDPIAIPPAIRKGETLFLNLHALAEHMQSVARRTDGPRDDAPTLRWDPKTNRATFSLGLLAVDFTLQEPVMQAGGRAVPLPASPFLSTPMSMYGERVSHLFVPLRPLIEELGGAVVTVNTEERWVLMQLPPWPDENQ